VWLGEGGAVDAISPWSVGRFSNTEEVERWAGERWGPDAEAVAAHNEALEMNYGAHGRGRRVDYLPVVLPGGSVRAFPSPPFQYRISLNLLWKNGDGCSTNE
jgi:hypothetical protein